MKKLTILLVLLSLCSGCSVFNWDMNHQESFRKEPGAWAKGAQAKVEYEGDKIVASAGKYTDGHGKEYPGEAEVRKGVNSGNKAWGSDFDLWRIGSQKEIKVDTSINDKGETNTATAQEPHGYTLTEWIIIIVAIVVGPLVLGGIATAIGFPAIGNVLMMLSPIKWLGALKGLIPTPEPEDTEETQENEDV